VGGRPGAWEDTIISLWKRIFPEWSPTSGYETDSDPRQERCLWRDDGKMLVVAWVPVIKKQGAAAGNGCGSAVLRRKKPPARIRYCSDP